MPLKRHWFPPFILKLFINIYKKGYQVDKSNLMPLGNSANQDLIVKYRANQTIITPMDLTTT